MVSVVVTGADGRTGRRLVPRLRSLAEVDSVVAVDALSPASELKGAMEGANVLIHLGAATAIGGVLEGAGSASSISRLIYRSSASVYGAWSDNRVPLTEDVPLRPNPSFSFAIEHAEAERKVTEWRDDHPGVAVAVLRPAPVVAPGDESWESNTLGRPSSLRRAESLPVAQFLHVDDAAGAFEHALTAGLSGTFNVAPDGFVSGETARALAATAGVVVPLPDRAAAVVERWAWRLGWGGVPAGAVPYLVHPWVVANDRLAATGWSPSFTNEEALVAARKGSWWRELSPKRRQELALSVAGVAGAGLVAGIVFAIRASRRRRI
ncbi:MAG TPA: NAD-dependent epimerase/dehydratase family protein [Acidimicrobiales bacterium]|nr:NAD-dependent epimerase/dehydratase family protein [Acidimicrobiales bacterium]